MGMVLDFEMRQQYFYVRLTGSYDSLEQAYGLYERMSEAAYSFGATKILVDCLELTGAPRFADYYAFGKFVGDQDTKSEDSARWIAAWVGTPPTFDKQHFTELVANNRGARMKVFDNMEDALKWLGVADTREKKEVAQ